MDPKLGDTAICGMCNEPIEYIGPYWRHYGENQPRHPTLPKEEWETQKPTRPEIDFGDLLVRLRHARYRAEDAKAYDMAGYFGDAIRAVERAQEVYS